MWAMTLQATGSDLTFVDLPIPVPSAHEILVKISACGVCRTDLHIIDGDLKPRHRNIVLGHEAVGYVVSNGSGSHKFREGERVGIPWLGGTCGTCPYCIEHHENLCDAPLFTGYDRNGGFAQYAVADERYCFTIPERYDDIHAAPLLCAGLIGYRAYRMCEASRPLRIGLYGFGAAAHIVCQIASAKGKLVYAFVRPGDTQGEYFAREMGAYWAGPSDMPTPQPLDAALIFAPVGELIPLALGSVRKGGNVICAGIHMSKIPAFDYSLLWGERSLRSVANLTREDGDLFFADIKQHVVHTRVQPFPLSAANEAIAALRSGSVEGAAVLIP